MPKEKDLKRLVRARTGENYLSAHAVVVGGSRPRRAESPAQLDEGVWLADLQSGDSVRQVRALHAACPCSGSSHLYERYMPVLQRMKKDRRPEIRTVALHLDEDALEVTAVADERANGFVRNRPGGWGRGKEPRRKAVRYGERDMPPIGAAAPGGFPKSPTSEERFESLLDQAMAAPVSDWRFPFLEERLVRVPTSWDYVAAARKLLRASRRALDHGTGGGEILLDTGRRPTASRSD